MTDAELVAALAEALFACVSPEVEGDEEDWDGAREIARGLLPVVRRVAEQRAAEAACYAWEQGYDSCRSGEQRRNPYRAAALTATPNHRRSAT